MGNRSELSREEIFQRIEEELLSSPQSGIKSFFLKTKSNYLMALLINLLLVLLVLLGGLFVYFRFRASEYELVGTPQSIRGLEEALYQELQKKISQELAQKEAELASTKAKLEEIQQRMSSYRQELQKSLAADIEKKRKELEQRLQESLQSASKEERQKLLAQYEEERKRLQENLQQEYQRREEEYKKSLLQEQQRLLSQSSNQVAQLEQAKKELSTVQTEYEIRLRALQQTNQQTINLLRAQLEGKQREETFRTQVEREFSMAMQFIREGRYGEAEQRLMQVSNLYVLRPSDIEVSSFRQMLDNFFVAALQDYIRLKRGVVIQEVSSLSLGRLKTLSEALQKGIYDRNPHQLEMEIKSLAKEMPEVFAFYSQYQDFLGRLQTSQLQQELKKADNLYAMKDYKAALLAYTAIARRYPLTTTREEIFKRISEAFSQWEANRQQTIPSPTAMLVTNVVTNVVSVVVTNMTTNALLAQVSRPQVITNTITNEVRIILKADEEKAAQLFSNALQLYKQNSPRVLDGFVSVITSQPMSSYVQSSLEYIQKIYETRYSRSSVEDLQKKQEEAAKLIYAQAETLREKGDYAKALSLYQEIILKNPLSSYVDRSLENLDRVYYRLLVGKTKFAMIESSLVARVMSVERDVLTLSLMRDKTLREGQRLKIYRKINQTDAEEIGKAVVNRVNRLIVQALVKELFEPIRPGDLVVGE